MDNDIPTQESILPEGSMAHLQSQRAKIGDFLRGTLRQAKKLPENVLGAAEATASLGSALGLMAPSFISGAIRQEPAGAMMERNMYIPRTEAGARHLQGAAEVLGAIPDVGPLPELQPFVGITRGVGAQARGAAKKAGEALAPAAANVAEEILGRQGLMPGVIKPKDGNWLPESTEVALSNLKKNKTASAALEEMKRVYPPEVMERLSEETRTQVERAIPYLQKESAINNWINRNLGNYIKKEMATPEDPVRKLAEQGITHLPDNTIIRGQWVSPNLELLRKSAMPGYPSSGMASSEKAKGWENLADEAIQLSAPIVESKEVRAANPWMEKLDPNQPIYRARPADISELGFDHIVDVLREDLQTGRIRPEQLSKVSMEQAVRRTFEYDQEKAREAARVALQQQEGLPVVKAYPEGYRWVELTPQKYSKENLPAGFKLEQWDYKGNPVWSVSDESGVTHTEAASTPEEALNRFSKSTSGNKKLEDALKYEGEAMGHCVGGYCPDVLEGRSQIFSLRDSKGEPHVTIEVKPQKQVDVDANEWINENAARGALEAGEINNLNDWRNASQEVKDWYLDLAKKSFDAEFKPNSLPPSIIQIKGKGNRAPKEDYLPFVQDFVTSGNWSQINDVRNAGLRRYTDVFNDAEQRKIEALGMHVPDHHWLTGKQIQELHNAIVPEGKRLKYDAYGNIIGDEAKHADGGLVSNTDNIARQLVANGMSEEDAFNRALLLANQIEMAGGGSVAKAAAKAAAKSAGKVAGKIDLPQQVLSPEESQANLQRLLEPSATKQRLYHGTLASEGGAREEAIRHIKPSKEGALGSGVYLTPQSEFASTYAGFPALSQLERDIQTGSDFAKESAAQLLDRMNRGIVESHEIGGNMIPVYAQIRNPLILEGKGDPMVEALTKLGMDQGKASRLVERAYENKGYIGKEVENRARAAGYDGLMQYHDGNLSEVVVYNPNAIKSAIGNRGTYDIYERDLSKAKGGEVKMQAGGLGKGAAKVAGKAAAKTARTVTDAEIEEMARRMSEQVLGQQTGTFVRQGASPLNPAGKSKVLWEREQNTPVEIEYAKKQKPAPIVKVEDLKDAWLLGVAGDPSIGGLLGAKKVKGSDIPELMPSATLRSVAGIDIPEGVGLFGGPRYGDKKKYWASNLSAASRVQNLANELGQEAPVYGQYMKMTPQSMDFAMHNLHTLLLTLHPERLDAPKLEQLNELVRQQDKVYGAFPTFAGFEKPEDVLLQAGLNSDLRKKITNILWKPKFTEPLGLRSGKEISNAIQHPELQNLETGASGFSIGRMVPGANLREFPSAHPTYSHDIPGEFIGMTKYPVPYELAFPVMTQEIKQNLKPGVDPFNMLKMSGARQRVDEPYIEQIKKYEDFMKRFTGKKKGGAVNKSSTGLPNKAKGGKVSGLSVLRK